VGTFAYRSTSASSWTCNRVEEQNQSNCSHDGGSRTTLVALICDCGEFTVLRATTTTVKNGGRQF